MKWQTIALIVVLVFIFLFIGYMICENVNGSCSCPLYSRPAPCGPGEQPINGESVRLHWYCKNACSSPPSCELTN